MTSVLAITPKIFAGIQDMLFQIKLLEDNSIGDSRYYFLSYEIRRFNL